VKNADRIHQKNERVMNYLYFRFNGLLTDMAHSTNLLIYCDVSAYFDLLYSNSMCRQSSMPTSILMELLASG